MSTAKITLLGMYKWMQADNDNLFANLNLPAFMDADKLTNTILLKGAEFEVLYADPIFMKSMIGVWSDRWYKTLDRWSKALAIEYNPLENYDRKEDWTDAGTKGRTANTDTTSSSNGTTSIINKGNQADTSANTNTTATSGNSDNEHKVSAYDASTYQPESTDINKNNETSASTGTGRNDRTTDNTSSAINGNNAQSHDTSTENEHNAAVHSGRTHGNIGVTTSQQMLEAELKVAKFNLYDEAADLFLQEFCIYTY